MLDPRLKSDCDKILAEEFVERLRADPILYNFLQTHASSIMITRQLSEGNVHCICTLQYMVDSNRTKILFNEVNRT